MYSSRWEIAPANISILQHNWKEGGERRDLWCLFNMSLGANWQPNPPEGRVCPWPNQASYEQPGFLDGASLLFHGGGPVWCRLAWVTWLRFGAIAAVTWKCPVLQQMPQEISSSAIRCMKAAPQCPLALVLAHAPSAANAPLRLVHEGALAFAGTCEAKGKDCPKPANQMRWSSL